MGAGFYGKLPMRGDFIRRNLPADFVLPWDEWLMSVLQAGQEGLGEAWLGRYLNSPIWRFVLGIGQCGSTGMVGVMIPSVDSVGRYFPLTVAAPIDGNALPALSVLTAEAWYETAETVLLRALEPETGFADFDAAVAGLPPPPEAAGTGGAGRFTVTANAAGLAASLLRLAADPESGRTSLWWTDGTPDLPGVSLCAAGLPSAEQGVALFDGQWERWGWTRR